jgi:4-amino-4-deoxy-L-arabinose transferase-like glycosyltransferase
MSSIPLFYIARFFSGLCAAFIVFFVYDIVKKLVPKDPILPKMTTLFVAFLPQFIFLSAYVNPDIVTALVATLILRIWFFCIDAKWSMLSAAALGAVLGFGILSKISGYSVVAATILFLFFSIPKEKSKLQYFSIVFLSCFLTSGWFFIRNQILYHDWTGYVAYTQQLKTFLSQAPRFVVEHDVFSFLNRVTYGWQAVPYLFHFCFSSFWGVFSWMSLALPKIFYTIAYALTGLSIAGLVVYFARKTKTTALPKIFLFVLMILGLQFFAIIFYVAMIKYQPQGRYFYPVIAPLAFVFCFGLLSFFNKESVRRLAFVGLSTFMVGLNIFSFLYCQALNYFIAFK